ncbi:MAG: DUF1643 domain-containing protein [Candidatus Pseudothioglobus sp.]
MKIIKKSAVFSTCKAYRYSLTRTWDLNQKLILFIGLNPSTADEKNDDPTLRRCLFYATEWGFGGLIMVNLFAFRATHPKDLKSAKYPIGIDNNQFIINAHDRAELTIAAWEMMVAFTIEARRCWNLLKIRCASILIKRVSRLIHFIKKKTLIQKSTADKYKYLLS